MSDKKNPCDMKATRWSITYWLTEDSGNTEETFQTCIQNMPTDWQMEGQYEKGEKDGKLHLQLLLKTPQSRGTRIVKFFPKCHIEEARNGFALQTYVHKEETRVGEFKTIENRSPQWAIVVEKFADWYIPQNPTNLSVMEEERLRLWDRFIGLSIEEGMKVDIIGVNPQYRSCILKYWSSYMKLAFLRLETSVDKKTDKTKDNESSGGGIIKTPLRRIVASIKQE